MTYHEQIFVERPLASQVTRASYQDSNIFLNKDETRPTVQKSATANEKEILMRNTNTFQSNVFQDETNSQNVRQRQQNTFTSSVFGEAVKNKVNRVKLGGDSKGTEVLFGNEAPQFE